MKRFSLVALLLTLALLCPLARAEAPETLEAAQARIAELETQLAEKDARIAELEALLDTPAAFDEDAAVVHYLATQGIRMVDPGRVVSLIPAILQG